MPKFTVLQLLQFLYDHGPAKAKEFTSIGIPSSSVNAYLADRLKNGSVQRIHTESGTLLALTDKGKRYVEEQLAAINVPFNKITPAPIHTPLADGSLETAIEQLSQAIVARISTTVEQQIGTMVDALVSKQVATTINKLTAGIASLPAAQPVVPVIPKRRVTVVGLIADQQRMIEKEFGGELDIRCLGSNDNSGLIKSNAAHSEAVFLMGDFISHSTVELVKPFRNTVLVKGGMSSLRDALTKFYVGE